MSTVKVVAMYLPQYHETKENSKFWGKGFTDWVTVRKATSLFDGHIQPKKPLNDNYYDLSIKDNIKWQADLARENGIYGFGIYHYWFSSNKNLLTTPAEIIYNNKDIEIPFLFAWDNVSWRRTWSKVKGNDWSPLQDSSIPHTGPEVLVQYDLGTKKDWIIHYEYLKKFFLDKRYIKQNNKPIFIIYNYDSELDPMVECWQELAKNDGFDGVEIIYKFNQFKNIPSNYARFSYEPMTSGWGSNFEKIKEKISNKIGVEKKLVRLNYDHVWKNIIKNAKKNSSSNFYHGAFVNYDDTPRRGRQGKVIEGGSPKKFEKYLTDLIKIEEKQCKEFIFLTAWNEWGEGAYLEPDSINKENYLLAVKNAIKNNENI